MKMAKIMRRATIALALMLSGLPALGAHMAGDPLTTKERCEPVEYVELKDMTKDDLQKAYCDYSGLISMHQGDVVYMETMKKVEPGAATYRQYGVSGMYVEQCFDQMARVGKLYQKLFREAPKCEGTPPETLDEMKARLCAKGVKDYCPERGIPIAQPIVAPPPSPEALAIIRKEDCLRGIKLSCDPSDSPAAAQSSAPAEPRAHRMSIDELEAKACANGVKSECK